MRVNEAVPDDPLKLFARWLEEASVAEPNDPNAFCLATADGDGRPSARMLLLKGFDPGGFMFFTNLESRKGGQLRANPFAAMCFHWKTLIRQVRIEGPVIAADAAESDAYYASRARQSQIGAWASRQSRPLKDRAEFEDRLAEFDRKYPGDVPRPPHWAGFRLVPERIEFWQQQEFRLHHRTLYTQDNTGGWSRTLLYP